MKKVALFLLLVSFLGCSDDDSSLAVKPGEFTIRLYDANDKLLLTRKGEVMVVGTEDVDGWEIRLLDPSFATQSANPIQTFASLTLFGIKSIESNRYVAFNDDASAVLHELWYSSQDSWSYASNSGSVVFTKVNDVSIDGFFEITLNVDQSGNQNVFWGTKVTAKGSFSAIPFDPNL